MLSHDFQSDSFFAFIGDARFIWRINHTGKAATTSPVFDWRGDA
jgi:hypothetical protein